MHSVFINNIINKGMQNIENLSSFLLLKVAKLKIHRVIILGILVPSSY